jgi:hypothetical protein
MWLNHGTGCNTKPRNPLAKFRCIYFAFQYRRSQIPDAFKEANTSELLPGPGGNHGSFDPHCLLVLMWYTWLCSTYRNLLLSITLTSSSY